jgi:hypothetical protein
MAKLSYSVHILWAIKISLDANFISYVLRNYYNFSQLFLSKYIKNRKSYLKKGRSYLNKSIVQKLLRT